MNLEGLGNTAEEVAATFTAMGIKGVPKSANDCPVVRYYYRCHPDGWSGLRAPRPGVLTFNDLQIMDPFVPTPVAEFMRRFDDGEFPSLRREGY